MCPRRLADVLHPKISLENRMLTLDLPAEPYWLDLPRGVRVVSLW